MHVYKREDGMWARVPLALIGGIITVALTRGAETWASVPTSYIIMGLVFAVGAVVTLYIAFFHAKTGEVLIETEGEMRKVVWPTREEVQGSTIVVIATVVILALLVRALDYLLIGFFTLIRLY